MEAKRDLQKYFYLCKVAPFVDRQYPEVVVRRAAADGGEVSADVWKEMW